jgi:hypothetical protein
MQTIAEGYLHAMVEVQPVDEHTPHSTWHKIVDDEIAKDESHLCCHSETAGTYLPMEGIKNPITARKVCPWRPIPGAFVHSCVMFSSLVFSLK